MVLAHWVWYQPLADWTRPWWQASRTLHRPFPCKFYCTCNRVSVARCVLVLYVVTCSLQVPCFKFYHIVAVALLVLVMEYLPGAVMYPLEPLCWILPFGAVWTTLIAPHVLLTYFILEHNGQTVGACCEYSLPLRQSWPTWTRTWPTCPAHSWSMPFSPL